ncbi:SLC45 family MFS transporter [Fructobacillus sp. M2-14]|uniref:SLC45 family MFS transporter n=1 Tax=Fructobacillus broussonetiae TaxID=2713173 RepID=A0ABS5QY62_9LACO|nr:MFS transporter [Fructobacillus broussonetiae]MBS9338134.1 SLC45 family MFS transporter [Fructobacillus broussonetiae]
MTNKQKSTKKNALPKLSQLQIFFMTFGFFGTQLAFSMQTGTMGRIFQTIGADPNKLGFFFILPPLAGLIAQPVIGYLSDRTWCPRLGRRMPYLIGGAIVAIIVMMLLPNAGSFGFGFASATALAFAATTVLFMDVACNVTQQPFKMLIPDMANEEQSQTLWSMQNIWGSLGALTASVFPFFLTKMGIANTEPVGTIPPSVRISFYLAAIILALSVLFTVLSVDEYTPEQMQAFHGLSKSSKDVASNRINFVEVVKSAPKVFWLLGLADFFVWIAIPYMWTYSTGALAEKIWKTTDPTTAAYQAAGNWFGMVQAVYCVTAVLVGFLFVKLNKKTRRPAYSLALILGAFGFLLIALGTSKGLSVLAFALFGIAWIAIITVPFTILTNALTGERNGVLLGLYNCFICIPQIVASTISFFLFPLLGHSMANMFYINAACFILGAVMIWLVPDEH